MFGKQMHQLPAGRYLDLLTDEEAQPSTFKADSIESVLVCNDGKSGSRLIVRFTKDGESKILSVQAEQVVEKMYYDVF